MNIDQYRHPVRFYILSTAIPWAFWCAAAYGSHQEDASATSRLLISLLSVVGLTGPMVVAFAMMAADPDSKVIQTVLLTLLTIWIVARERNLFFDRAYSEAD